MSPDICTRFTDAVVRTPAESVARGLRINDNGDPDPVRFRDEHLGYCAALQAAGVHVHEFAPLDAYPDSVFVEDPALVLPQGAIMLRPGAASRRGEVGTLADDLARIVPIRHRITEGAIDGGDILVTGQEVIVGLSDRTDRAGFSGLAAVLADWNYPARLVEPPAGLLHLKTGCAVLDRQTVLAIPSLASSKVFTGYEIVPVPQGENAAANAIRVNDHVILAAGFPKTATRLRQAGYSVNTVPVTQAARIDGGLSCMSLRYRRTANL